MARKASPEVTTEPDDIAPEMQGDTEAAAQDQDEAPPPVEPVDADSIPDPTGATGIEHVLTAIARCTADVKRIAKGNNNKEKNYHYSSIDDFLAMTGPICAKHSLVVVQQEAGIKYGKTGRGTEVLEVAFDFYVYHATSGQGLPYPIRRSVEVYRGGAQPFGAAQSYALKTFLRGLLQIPTGDSEDPDAGRNDQPSKQDQRQEQRQEQQRPQDQRQQGPQEPRQQRQDDNRTQQQGQQQQQPQTQQQAPRRTVETLVNDLITSLRTAKTLEELEAMNSTGQFLYEKWGWLEDNGKTNAADMVQQAYAEHRNKLALPEPQTAPRHNDLDDEIPY